MSFISRKDLEIHHTYSYQMRGRLKQLGCEWDAIARVWIAPTLEVKELCLAELDAGQNKDNSIQYRYLGNCGWQDVDYEALEKAFDTSHGALPEEAKSIAHNPSKEEAIKICGEENVKRYWHEDIPEKAAEILASGENNESDIAERLRFAGWNGRQVSLLIDVVDHFRKYPPIPALDEKLGQDEIISTPIVKPEQMQGSIGIICDEENPVAITIRCPYDPKIVKMIKSGNLGQKWNPDQKRWEIPIKYAQDILKRFPHFSRSPKAKEIESK